MPRDVELMSLYTRQLTEFRALALADFYADSIIQRNAEYAIKEGSNVGNKRDVDNLLPIGTKKYIVGEFFFHVVQWFMEHRFVFPKIHLHIVWDAFQQKYFC